MDREGHMVDDLIVTAGIAALDGEVQNLGEHPGEVGVEEDIAAALADPAKQVRDGTAGETEGCRAPSKARPRGASLLRGADFCAVVARLDS
jgi:hypothetical protein